MAIITIKIKNSKVNFFMELIKNFDFIKVEKQEGVKLVKEEIKENITQGLKEVQLIEQGEKKATPLKDFINEL